MRQTFIIAEAGVNHNGSLELALKMVGEAAKAGADAVKFQTFKAEKSISANAPKASYQIETTGSSESQLEMARKLELGEDDHIKLSLRCRELGIFFLSTPFDLDSIEFLSRMGMEMFKIPSGEITNLPHLKKIGALGKKILLSTGMSEMREIEDALKILISAGTPKEFITVLHCNTEYPTPMEDANLRAMLTIRDVLNVRVGYSDHTLGIEAPIAAVALGAEVIEKHFTLDRNMPGPDHSASLLPDELKSMVSAIRNIEKAMGDGIKRPTPSELKNIPIARKSIVASGHIKAGEEFTPENLTSKRPATGISPMMWDSVIGRRAKRDFNKDDLIEI